MQVSVKLTYESKPNQVTEDLSAETLKARRAETNAISSHETKLPAKIIKSNKVNL